jgi:hypothetical protein
MVESFADRLQAEVTAAEAFFVTPCLVGAWTRKLESSSSISLYVEGKEPTNKVLTRTPL